ncbi:hypothetical protein EVAR_75496_1 [Eumeta japonica]|uniref:Uncharacterized protein n=1 Tax=Eumeta variegata TaxID=151549 RepID=A0A4C1TLI4_EUMVA|nr:hypothetical protein EVAR_75496_1 [Eumeta japonica]
MRVINFAEALEIPLVYSFARFYDENEADRSGPGGLTLNFFIFILRPGLSISRHIKSAVGRWHVPVQADEPPGIRNIVSDLIETAGVEPATRHSGHNITQHGQTQETMI